jgi:hypothetical protein
MKATELNRYLVRQIETASKKASIEVAKMLVEEIKRNTSASKGFGDDEYKKRLSIITVRKKQKRGTYVKANSTLRDSDHSIEGLRHAVVGGRGIIDFRSTGKGDLFYAHNYGKPAPKPYDKFTAKRSLVPETEQSIPRYIHEAASRIIAQELGAKGVAKIRIINRKADTGPDDWRNDITY